MLSTVLRENIVVTKNNALAGIHKAYNGFKLDSANSAARACISMPIDIRLLVQYVPHQKHFDSLHSLCYKLISA